MSIFWISTLSMVFWNVSQPHWILLDRGADGPDPRIEVVDKGEATGWFDLVCREVAAWKSRLANHKCNGIWTEDMIHFAYVCRYKKRITHDIVHVFISAYAHYTNYHHTGKHATLGMWLDVKTSIKERSWRWSWPDFYLHNATGLDRRTSDVDAILGTCAWAVDAVSCCATETHHCFKDAEKVDNIWADSLTPPIIRSWNLTIAVPQVTFQHAMTVYDLNLVAISECFLEASELQCYDVLLLYGLFN